MEERMIYRFGKFKLDSINYRVLKNEQSVAIEPQVFNLLFYLISHRNRLVTRQEIFDNLWAGREVSDTTLSNHIKSARKVIGDNGHHQQKISTFHGRGYQFIADITEEPIENQMPTVNSHAPTLKSIIFISLIVFTLFLFLFFKKNSTNTNYNSMPRVAVLPFINNKPSPSTDYFGFAITDQIISDLMYLKTISIKPSASVRKYTNKIIDPGSVGKKLKADFLVVGNYLKEKNIIKLNVELIDVVANEFIWRDTISVNFKDIFQLQEIVARKVAQALNLKFSTDEIDNIRQDISSDPLAYEYYLKSLSYPYSTEGHQLAIAMLEKSIQLDDKFAPAIAFLGYHLRLYEQHGLVNLDAKNKVEHYYLKALAINPDSLSSLSYLSSLYTETNRIEKAIHTIQRMLKININSAHAHFSLGYIYRYAGMLEESISEMEKALFIEPGNTQFRSIVTTYFSIGDYENVLKYLWLDQDPIFQSGWKGLIYFRQGRVELAKHFFEQVVEKVPDELFGIFSGIHIAYIQKNFQKGLALIKKTEPDNIIDGENVYRTASFYCLFGKRTPCLKFFEMAIDVGYFNYPFMVKNKYFDKFKSDPEYLRILEKGHKKHLAFKNKFL